MTKFRGRKTAFNPSGSNDVTPNCDGPSKTKFKGRGGLPEGALGHYPGIVDDVSAGNRRLARSKHGDGGGSGVVFNGSPNGFK